MTISMGINHTLFAICDLPASGALQKYHELNGQLPDRIVIYRDGVGDGQLPAVVEHEIPQMLECFKAIGQDYK